VVIDANMLLFKTSAATSNTSNTKDMKNKSLSFQDILEKKIDNSKEVDRKDNVLPKRITVVRKDTIVSSEKQTEKNEANLQKDEIVPKEEPISEFEHRSQCPTSNTANSDNGVFKPYF